MKALLVSAPFQTEPPTHVSLSALTPARRDELAAEYRELGYIVEVV